MANGANVRLELGSKLAFKRARSSQTRLLCCFRVLSFPFHSLPHLHYKLTQSPHDSYVSPFFPAHFQADFYYNLMVQISIHALRNLNHGGRSYPHSGFLGLTKLLVEGVVRTRVDDDHKLMAASSITISIKCYEARTKLTYSRINTLVDATTILWSSPVHECTDIGDMDLPFRITLPSSVSGYSNLSFPEYKVFWRLEAGEFEFLSIFYELGRMAGSSTMWPPFSAQFERLRTETSRLLVEAESSFECQKGASFELSEVHALLSL